MDKKYPSSSYEARKAWLAKQDPEKIKAQRQAQYLRAKERGLSKRHQAYYQANKERIKAKSQEYRLADPERDKAMKAAYYQAHKDEIKARAKAWSRQNPIDPEQRRRHLLKTRYSLTIEQYDDMLKAQDGGCKICGTDRPGKKGRFHIDHNHSTGEVRGLLCHYCNVSLGGFKDNPDLLRAAATYVEKHND